MTKAWLPARITTVSEKACKKKIRVTIEKFRHLRRHPLTDGRDHSDKINEMKVFLAKLCDLAPKDLYERSKSTTSLNGEWKDDWKFYNNMCQPIQIGSMGSKDLVLCEKETAKQKRIDKKSELADIEALSEKRGRRLMLVQNLMLLLLEKKSAMIVKCLI